MFFVLKSLLQVADNQLTSDLYEQVRQPCIYNIEYFTYIYYGSLIYELNCFLACKNWLVIFN